MHETNEQTLVNKSDIKREFAREKIVNSINVLTKRKCKNLMEQILKFRKPIDLIINHAIEKLLNVLVLKEDQYFCKKNIRDFLKKIYFYKTKPYKNIFEAVRTYKNNNNCIFCRNWIRKTHFHRHIDECRRYCGDKDFCNACKRYIILEITINDKILHKHVCHRKQKFVKPIKNESKARWKRRRIGEKKMDKIFSKRNHFQHNDNYLKKIVSDFVNQRRKDIINRIKDIKNGYPEEYLDLYRSETDYPYHFKIIFKDLIGKIGRFYGDTTKETYFNLEKEFQIRKKYELNFKFINLTANRQETIYVQEQIQNCLLNLTKIKIPKFRKVKIYNDMMKTYLLACAERRKIDEELKIAFIKISKIKSKTCIDFIKFDS